MRFPELPTDSPQRLIDLLPYYVKEFIAIAGLIATIKLINQYKRQRVIFNTLAKDKAIVSLIGYEAIELTHNKMIPFVVSLSNHIHTSTSSVRTVL
ncbi:MAG: hypothetical protein NTW85_02430 [Methylococcales bacterium]|nr:hypothetical protein [Methylococcales bacterium]